MGFYQKTLSHYKDTAQSQEVWKRPLSRLCPLADVFLALQGQALGGLCLRPGPPAPRPQADAAEPAGEQGWARGAAGCGPDAPPAAAARAAPHAHADQRRPGAADHQEHHGEEPGRPPAARTGVTGTGAAVGAGLLRLDRPRGKPSVVVSQDCPWRLLTVTDSRISAKSLKILELN